MSSCHAYIVISSGRSVRNIDVKLGARSITKGIDFKDVTRVRRAGAIESYLGRGLLGNRTARPREEITERGSRIRR